MDPERLALPLRGGLSAAVWIPPAAVREARELIRRPVQLVWLRRERGNRVTTLPAPRTCIRA